MSKLISGKDVVVAILSGNDLLWKKPEWEHDEKEDVNKSMWSIEELLTGKTVTGDIVEFYLKPRTISINGVEVPAPFEPKDGDMVWCINELSDKGYEARPIYDKDDFIPNIAYWRTEEEIKQVVEALRSVFK